VSHATFPSCGLFPFYCRSIQVVRRCHSYYVSPGNTTTTWTRPLPSSSLLGCGDSRAGSPDADDGGVIPWDKESSGLSDEDSPSPQHSHHYPSWTWAAQLQPQLNSQMNRDGGDIFGQEVRLQRHHRGHRFACHTPRAAEPCRVVDAVTPPKCSN
jgi:hypothetical protein